MLVTDYEEPGPYERPEQGSLWTMVFDGASNALGNRICDVIISAEDCCCTPKFALSFLKG